MLKTTYSFVLVRSTKVCCRFWGGGGEGGRVSVCKSYSMDSLLLSKICEIIINIFDISRLYYDKLLPPPLQKNCTWGRIFSQAGNELGTSKARGIRDNHHETRSLLVPSSFPAWLKIRPQKNLTKIILNASSLIACFLKIYLTFSTFGSLLHISHSFKHLFAHLHSSRMIGLPLSHWRKGLRCFHLLYKVKAGKALGVILRFSTKCYLTYGTFPPDSIIQDHLPVARHSVQD